MTTTPDASTPESTAGATAPEATIWWWRLDAVDGSEVSPAEGRQEFPTRSDAESYIGEEWAALAEQGVASVTLFEAEREVYGPMSLAAE